MQFSERVMRFLATLAKAVLAARPRPSLRISAPGIWMTMATGCEYIYISYEEGAWLKSIPKD